MTGTTYLAIALAAIFFWVFFRIITPAKRRRAAKDILEQESRTAEEGRIVDRSPMTKFFYPLFMQWKKISPTGERKYNELQRELIKAGEYNSRPEDIQMAQLINAVVYPLIILVIGFIFGREWLMYIVLGGMALGVYMYRAPLGVVKSKQKKHEEQLLVEFTRIVTVYLMQISGNNTPDVALKRAIDRVYDRSYALSYYLKTLTSNIETKGTVKALEEFASEIDKPYVDRFVSNVQLSIKHAGGDQQSLNLRLRETLAEMQDQVIEGKIASMKVKARIPVFASIGIISVYLIIILGVSLLMIF